MPYDDISEVKNNKSYDGEDIGAYWHRELEEAKKVFDKWETRGKKVVRRYRDERDAVEVFRLEDETDQTGD